MENTKGECNRETSTGKSKIILFCYLLALFSILSVLSDVSVILWLFTILFLSAMSVNTKRFSLPRELEHVWHLFFSFVFLGTLSGLNILGGIAISMALAGAAAETSILFYGLFMLMGLGGLFGGLALFFILFGFYKWWKSENVKTRLISSLKRTVIYIAVVELIALGFLYLYVQIIS